MKGFACMQSGIGGSYLFFFVAAFETYARCIQRAVENGSQRAMDLMVVCVRQ